MKREQIEQLMKQEKINNIDIIYNETDKLAVYCMLKNGKLYDYTAHVVNRKADIWGYLKWENGKSTRVAFRKEN